jgi:hypothetical protein
MDFRFFSEFLREPRVCVHGTGSQKGAPVGDIRLLWSRFWNPACVAGWPKRQPCSITFGPTVNCRPLLAAIPPPLHLPGTSDPIPAPRRPLRLPESATHRAGARKYHGGMELRPAGLPTRRRQCADSPRRQSIAGDAHRRSSAISRTVSAILQGCRAGCWPIRATR